MDLDIVLNELSFRAPAPDVASARGWMNGLIQTVIEAIDSGANRVLRAKEDVNSYLLAPGYPVAQWRNDLQVDRDARLYFGRLATMAPVLVDMPEMYQEFLIREFNHGGMTAVGLGAAYLCEWMAVSVLSEDLWGASKVQLGASRILDDGSLISESVSVIHASKAAHVREHRDWIKERTRRAIRNGQDFWGRREDLFPSLAFCERVREQLAGLGCGDPLLRQVVKRLDEFEAFCENWTEGNFDASKLPCKATPESPSTLQSYARERTFRCPDGTDRTFTWHVRVTPGSWRIHFFPLPETQRILIGHIGPKLPTTDYPT
jgi:hypothetical protein